MVSKNHRRVVPTNQKKNANTGTRNKPTGIFIFDILDQELQQILYELYHRTAEAQNRFVRLSVILVRQRTSSLEKHVPAITVEQSLETMHHVCDYVARLHHTNHVAVLLALEIREFLQTVNSDSFDNASALRI